MKRSERPAQRWRTAAVAVGSSCHSRPARSVGSFSPLVSPMSATLGSLHERCLCPDIHKAYYRSSFPMKSDRSRGWVR
jgi:hypothetical protein